MRSELGGVLTLPRKKKTAAKNTGFARPRLRTFYFLWAGVADEKSHDESDYPTQAKRRLEWGTQHLLPAENSPGRQSWTAS